MNRHRNTAAAEPVTAPVRCAIYTRKSTEEGLEQEFNTLDAQRESGESFIASQRQSGWIPVPDRYDDGGYSGGTLDRPALQRLIQDMEAGKVNCIVVYKIDRLSRSLLDFTRLVDLFERHGVSFVSVTQQFNTTTSMGRLTLNILLSFAQFEREIIGERIRDKIAAAKRKGKYTGGPCVLGYDVDRENHRLLVNPDEAETVRYIFQRFIETGSAQKLVQNLNERGLKTKSWVTGSGRSREGVPWNTAFVYRLLHNHLYVGEINHKGSIYPGEHEAIVSRTVWDKVQTMLAENDRTQGNRSRKRHDALLKGAIRCGHCGCGMTHSFARKKGKMYRYYVCMNALKNGYAACPLKTLPAGDVEQMVMERMRKVFNSPTIVAQVYREAQASTPHETSGFTETDVVDALARVDELWDNLFPAEQARIAQLLVERVVATRDSLEVELRPEGMLSLTSEMNTAEENSDGQSALCRPHECN